MLHVSSCIMPDWLSTGREAKMKSVLFSERQLFF